MKSNLNKHLLTAEDILRYAEPETEDETILFGALRVVCRLANELSAQHENLLYDNGRLEEEKLDLNTKLETSKALYDDAEAELNTLRSSVAEKLTSFMDSLTSLKEEVQPS
jgi:peptidoglycan hydrolase CwlO-like protein